MRHPISLSVAVLAGAVLGGVTVGGLNAQQQQQQPGQQIQSQSQQSQTQRPRFFVVTLQEITDQQKYTSEYAPKVTKTILDHQGRFIVRNDQITHLQGNLGQDPKRVVILGFDSMDQIQRWQNSADYKDLAPIRNQVMKLNQFAVATCPQQGQQPQAGQQACPN